MTKLPTLVDMLKAGAHFGHQRSRWHPKMEQYIFGARGGVHIVNLEKTLEELSKAIAFAKELAAKGQVLLFVGTKRQAREIVKAAAVEAGMPYITERWIGGLLTNFEECKRRLKKYRTLKDQVATGEIEKYTKREQTQFKKQLEKMDKYLAGLITLEGLPNALYIADLRVEKTALTEARSVGLPVIAVCDTNVDPSKVKFPIPCNDDAVNAIKMMADLIAEAINDGKKEAEKKKAAAVEESGEKTTTPAPVKKERRAVKKEESI